MIKCRLKVLLCERELSQKELATRLHFQVATINKLANNKLESISLYMLDSICKELKCSPGDLFEYIPDDGEDSKFLKKGVIYFYDI